ncbi:MAG: 16S rRNA processing protein RimM [Desulfuromonadales bacterium]|nr:16S rRNA processing protein RimM [Desulfuromonadales bacterium]
MRDSEELIPVGKIIGTHGIKGQMKLHSYSGNADSLSVARSVTLKSPAGVLREVTLQSFNANSGKFIIGIKDFDDINLVEAFMGNEICLKRCQLSALDDDEYYWSDLIGLKVITDDGTLLGTVADIFETGSSDIYVVRNEEREYLIPAIGDVIKDIDPVGGKIIVTPIDGLLDL